MSHDLVITSSSIILHGSPSDDSIVAHDLGVHQTDLPSDGLRICRLTVRCRRGDRSISGPWLGRPRPRRRVRDLRKSRSSIVPQGLQPPGTLFCSFFFDMYQRPTSQVTNWNLYSGPFPTLYFGDLAARVLVCWVFWGFRSSDLKTLQVNAGDTTWRYWIPTRDWRSELRGHTPKTIFLFNLRSVTWPFWWSPNRWPWHGIHDIFLAVGIHTILSIWGSTMIYTWVCIWIEWHPTRGIRSMVLPSSGCRNRGLPILIRPTSGTDASHARWHEKAWRCRKTMNIYEHPEQQIGAELIWYLSVWTDSKGGYRVHSLKQTWKWRFSSCV